MALLALAALAGVPDPAGESALPTIWPAGGLLAGLLLTSPRQARPWLLLVSGLLVALAHLLIGFSPAATLGLTLTYLVAAWVVRRSLVAGRSERVALRDQGDVSRLIGAVAAGSLVAGLGSAATVALTGLGNPWLALAPGFGAHAAALMVLLPLFLPVPHFAPVSGPRERVVQALLTVGTTLAIFTATDIPPVVFAVMPMFAWYAFRGTLREATLLLTLVSAVGVGVTALDTGPIWGLGQRYDLPPELVHGVLQLFVVDCALILLPLSVMLTQQRMSAALVSAERETLRRLVDAARGTAIIATGPDGQITVFNPGAEEMLGHRAADVLGGTPDLFLPESELRRHSAELGTLATFASICNASTARDDDQARLWHCRRSDGQERTLRMTLSAVSDENGALSGYLATAEDVTEREEARLALEISLARERDALERGAELERVKGNFVATVSHELRTPVTSIVGYTEVLEDGLIGPLSHDQLAVVAKIDRNGRRMQNLVEDLLTLSEIESSRLTIRLEAVDVGAVVRRALASLDEVVAGRQLSVEVSLPEEPLVQAVDPRHLERMVTGLVSNAVKFTPDGGAVEVLLTGWSSGCEVVVRDTGIGIEPTEQAGVFERFARGRRATEDEAQGTGLGLTIIRAIVALHGGEVTIDSEVDRGTTVTVLLPRSDSSAAPGTAHAPGLAVLDGGDDAPGPHAGRWLEPA
ncbi:sensor histidine kinase [Nocardioides scoriae]|nr:ATP-binding protein [Nocardioides scoriae]